jgi:hypothetical protein
LSPPGASILLAKKTRTAATYLGTWIVLLVVFIYGPILIAALADPSTAVKVEALNYFFDTLLFAGAILALASAIAAHRLKCRRDLTTKTKPRALFSSGRKLCPAILQLSQTIGSKVP